MAVWRVIGWAFLALALIAFGAEVIGSLSAGHYRILTLGEVWFSLSPGSLNLTQAVIQRYLFAALWDPVIVTVLLGPAWALPLLISLLSFIAGPRRRRRMFFKQRR
jgi:hypothetical protein